MTESYDPYANAIAEKVVLWNNERIRRLNVFIGNEG